MISEQRGRLPGPMAIAERWIDACGQMMRLPLAFFAVGAELASEMLTSAAGTACSQTSERTARSLPPPETPAPPPVAASGGAPPRAATQTVPIVDTPRSAGDGGSQPQPPATPQGGAPGTLKEIAMADTNLSDDMLKLVQYSIVCIERGKEKVLVCNECKFFADNMTDCDFDAWVISDYTRDCARRASDPKEKPCKPCKSKYLRVTYEVKARWPKEDLNYEEKQLRRLEGISEAILYCCSEDKVDPKADAKAIAVAAAEQALAKITKGED